MPLAFNTGSLSCDTDTLFTGLCQAIAAHDPSGVAGPIVERLLTALLIFLVIVIAGRVIRQLMERVPAIRTNAQVRTLVHNVMTVTTFLFAILAGLVGAGVSISVLLTFGGLTSLGIGLAFQDVLRNILAGIFLLVDQPFRVGDWVSVDTFTGEVQTIQLRTTAVRTVDGRLAILPNLYCFTNPVINLTAFDQRRYEVVVRVPRTKPLGEVLETAQRELLATKGINAKPAPQIQPALDGEEVLLHCQYWLDYKTKNADAIAADLARRIAPLGMTAAA